VDHRRALLHADVTELTDNELFASWQRTATQLWERYSDSELDVILDFLADTDERLRTRTEALGRSRAQVLTAVEVAAVVWSLSG